MGKQDVDGRDIGERSDAVLQTLCPVVTKRKSTFAGAGLENNYSGGGGRNMTSCLAESATTSGGVCSFMLWMAQNRS